MKERPLDGVRVLELGQLLAGPFAGSILGYFGAEVIKVEPPVFGDPVRGWRGIDDDGTSVWWRSIGRNKKCVTLDLRQKEGQRIARELALRSDVVLENFKPGTLERWGIGPDDIEPHNPGVVFARISGYGQTGPYSSRPGFASVCEAVGGMRFVTGFPDRPPARSNISLGDGLAGLHAVIGILLALYRRDRRPREGERRGEVVDVAIYEAVFNMMEGLVAEYDRFGVVRQREGTTLTGIVPTNAYPCRDGGYVVIGGNGDSIFKRLMRAAGREDMASDPRLATNPDRVQHAEEIDAAIAAWTSTLTPAQVVDALNAADVPVGLIYSAADIAADSHYAARNMLETVDVGGRPLKIPAISPKLREMPGRTEWAGPDLGTHNREIFEGLLGLSPQELARLTREGIIGPV
jgi:crotonobetainyl-CoA:carnitine CoA-transferase CaiB-like acyl-CoA transferase